MLVNRHLLTITFTWKSSVMANYYHKTSEIYLDDVKKHIHETSCYFEADNVKKHMCETLKHHTYYRWGRVS